MWPPAAEVSSVGRDDPARRSCGFPQGDFAACGRRPTLPMGGLSSEVQRFVEKEFKRRFPAQAFARATI